MIEVLLFTILRSVLSNHVLWGLVIVPERVVEDLGIVAETDDFELLFGQPIDPRSHDRQVTMHVILLGRQRSCTLQALLCKAELVALYHHHA